MPAQALAYPPAMIDPSVLWLFVPTFLFVSATPGMCMTLAMTMGIAIGPRRTLWMMGGELLGVGLVSLAAVLGVAAVLLAHPALFSAFKYAGGAYLAWLGVELWRSRGRMALAAGGAPTRSAGRRQLALQGFVTAVANPKGWAFMVALLPPFIDPARPLAPQLAALVGLILVIEFGCLIGYAMGGMTLRRVLQRSGNVQLINRVAGSLMLGVGAWLALG